MSCPYDIFVKAICRRNLVRVEIVFEVIEDRGLKKTWIAKQIGVARGTFSLIVNGKSEPTLRVALRIEEK